MAEYFEITALKRYGEGSCTPCAVDDPDADEWRVSYPQHVVRFECALRFRNRMLASEVAGALRAVFESGKRARSGEIRTILGVD